MRQTKQRVFVGTLLAVVAVGTWHLTKEEIEERWTVRIATATEGGTYYPLGVRLGQLLTEIPDGPVDHRKVLTTAGSMENISLLAARPSEDRPSPSDEQPGDELRPSTEDDWADVGFVQASALAMLEPEARARIRALAALYTDVAQVLVRTDAGVENLDGLRGRTIYIGKERSGTKVIAEALLAAAGLEADDYERGAPLAGFADVPALLATGELDAAVLVSGTPTVAVREALLTGRVRLLDVGVTPEQIGEHDADLGRAFRSVSIQGNFYEGQTESVQTVATHVILTCSANLPPERAIRILETAFDRIEDFLLVHSRVNPFTFVEEIRFQSASNAELLGGLELHPGAATFWQRENEKLLVATGTLTDEYHRLGGIFRTLLVQNGIDARAIHTDGSIENAGLMQEPDRRVLAIMQYDTALALRLGYSRPVYGREVPVEDSHGKSLRIEDLRRIATLHRETAHIVARRKRLRDDVATVRALEGLRIGVGPINSGTRVLATAILAQHDLTNKVEEVSLPVAEMVQQLHEGELDAGIFVGARPSAALRTVLASDQFRLLSVDPGRIAEMLSEALTQEEIPTGSYSCQLEGEPPVQTIATRALLVTRQEDESDGWHRLRALPLLGPLFARDDIYEITRILAGGPLDAKAMAEHTPSIPLHPDAKRYYEESGVLPAPRSKDWLGIIWRSLAIVVMVLGGYRGLISLRRERRSHRLGREILRIDVSGEEPNSVAQLVEKREELNRSVQLRFWQLDELDRGRWANLKSLIDSRTVEAKDNLKRHLLERIRKAGGDDAEYRRLLYLIAEHLERGELDEGQYNLLVKIIRQHFDGDAPQSGSAA